MQTAYELVWTFRIDPEIGAREREQNGEISLANKDCVETNPAFVRPPQTQRERDWRAVCRITKRACDPARSLVLRQNRYRQTQSTDPRLRWRRCGALAN